MIDEFTGISRAIRRVIGAALLVAQIPAAQAADAPPRAVVQVVYVA